MLPAPEPNRLLMMNFQGYLSPFVCPSWSQAPQHAPLCGLNCASARTSHPGGPAFMSLERDSAARIGTPLATGGLMTSLSIYVALIFMCIAHALQDPWEAGDHCYLQSSARWNNSLGVTRHKEAESEHLCALWPGGRTRTGEQCISRRKQSHTAALF